MEKFSIEMLKRDNIGELIENDYLNILSRLPFMMVGKREDLLPLFGEYYQDKKFFQSEMDEWREQITKLDKVVGLINERFLLRPSFVDKRKEWERWREDTLDLLKNFFQITNPDDWEKKFEIQKKNIITISDKILAKRIKSKYDDKV